MKMPEEKVRVQSVTIRQLQSVEKVEHDRMFKLIGILEYVSTQQSSWLFQLGDSTGQVDMVKDVIVSRRIESQEERIRREMDEFLEIVSEVPEPKYDYGKYHRIFGNYNPERKLFEVTSIQLVEDFNEITTHNLECIWQHIQSNKSI